MVVSNFTFLGHIDFLVKITFVQPMKYIIHFFLFLHIVEANLKEQSKNKESQSQVKEILQERLDLYKVEIEENELNLRRNIILGGIFYFDMLQIPPQPKRIANWIICQLETPQVFLDIIQARDRIQIIRII